MLVCLTPRLGLVASILQLGRSLVDVVGEFMAAWSIWSSGAHADELPLWGSTVIYWGRVGKVAEFVAALVVIAELVGREHLNRYGVWLARISDANRRFWWVYPVIAAGVVTAFRGLWGGRGANVAVLLVGFGPLLVGWFLARGRVLTYIKIGGLVVLAAGFVLDLLAS